MTARRPNKNASTDSTAACPREDPPCDRRAANRRCGARCLAQPCQKVARQDRRCRAAGGRSPVHELSRWSSRFCRTVMTRCARWPRSRSERRILATHSESANIKCRQQWRCVESLIGDGPGGVEATTARPCNGVTRSSRRHGILGRPSNRHMRFPARLIPRAAVGRPLLPRHTRSRVAARSDTNSVWSSSTSSRQALLERQIGGTAAAPHHAIAGAFKAWFDSDAPPFRICLYTDNEIAHSPMTASQAQTGPRGVAKRLAAPGGVQPISLGRPFLFFARRRPIPAREGAGRSTSPPLTRASESKGSFASLCFQCRFRFEFPGTRLPRP
jgi:hypothetical protein